MKTLLQADPNQPEVIKKQSTPVSSYIKDVVDDPNLLWRGFSYGSVVGTVANALKDTPKYEADETYNVYEDPRLINYRKFIPKYFANSTSAKETTDLLKDFEKHISDTSNPMYHIASLMGELSDPSNWVFGSGLIKGAKTVQSFKKAGEELTKFSKLMVGEEAIKQVLNEDRAYEDALVVGGFAWYINKLGKKFKNYEDGAEAFSEMKFYENASNSEIPPIISKPTSDAMYAKQANTIDEAINAIKAEYPDMIIKRGKGVGKNVNGKYVPAFVRRNKDLSVAQLNLDEEGIVKMFREGRHLKSTVPGVIPFKKGDFKNEGEWLEFVTRHELAHVRLPKEISETKADYENRINKIAYDQILENRSGNVARQGSILVDQQIINNAIRLSERKYRNKIDPRITDDQLKTINTGTFLERIGYNPLDRVMNTDNRTAKEYTLNMLKNSLYIEANKLPYGQMPDSAEAIKAVDYTPLLKDFVDGLEDLYADYLKGHGINKMDIGKKIKLSVFKDKQILSSQQFKEAVPYAILRGYKYPEIPQVEQAARLFDRTIVKPLGDKINKTGLYLIKPDKEYEFFKRGLDELEIYFNPKSKLYNPNKQWTYTYPRTGKKVVYSYEQLKDKVKSLEDLINDVKLSGTRKNYFTVMWNFEFIEKNFDTFYKDVYPIILKNSDEDYAKRIMDNFKNYRPYEAPEETIEGVLPGDEFIFKEPSYSKYLRSRSIPLKDVDYEFMLDKRYIASDIEYIATQYFKSVVPDIILTEKYGDPFAFGYMYDLVPDTFAPGLRQIAKEYDEKIYGKPQVNIKRDDLDSVDIDEEGWVNKSRKNFNVESGKETTLTLYRGKTTELGNNYFQGNVDFGKGGGQYWGTSLEHASYYSNKIVEADVTLKNPYVINDDLDLAILAITHKLKIGGPDKVLKSFPEKVRDKFEKFLFMGDKDSIKFYSTLELQKRKQQIVDDLDLSEDDLRSLMFREFMLGRSEVDKGFIAGDWAKDNGFDSIVINVWGKEGNKSQNARVMFDQNEAIIFKDLYEPTISKNVLEEQKKKKKVLKDTEAVRDLFKGRFGLAKNPQRFLSRFYRLIKPFNSSGMLSGALAGLPDIARIVTYNGLKRSSGRLLQFFNASVSNLDIFKKANRQANRAGQAIEFMLDGGRANQVYGSHHDTFATMNNLDRTVQSISSFNFKYINGMASWTWFWKTAASNDIGTEIIEASLRFVNGKATKKDMMRFNHAGVAPGEIKDIADAYKKYGFGKDGIEYNPNYNLLKFANTENWIENPKEINAAFRFNRMLNEGVDYQIITPTLGDTPLFASDELGAVILQFKKFIFAFDRKVMQRGLQERDLSFLTQMGALLFFGMVVDGIRSSQLGKDYSKKDIREKIYDGFERAGVGGIFLETNRMLETLTDNRIGLRPLVGIGKPYGTSLAWKTGVLGPTASQFATVSQIMYDWGRGKHTHHTARRIRKLVPFNNIWYLDSIFDKLEKGIR